MAALPPSDVGRIFVRLLGGFAVVIDGIELPAERWLSLRSAQLVQLLCLAEDRRLPREQVMDALWARLDPEAGAANLRKAVHHARQALGRHDAVALQGGTVSLWPGKAVVVDAVEFAHRAHAALDLGDALACAEVARGCGGDLLPGSRYEAWVEPARERLHASLLRLLRQAGDWDRLVHLDPADEPAQRALMARELAAGNRAAAIRAYARLRHALQEEFGVRPAPETESLYARCVAGLQRAGSEMIGREMARAQVAAWLGCARRDRPGGLVVLGAAGIGKSAFGREIDTVARERGFVVVGIDAAQPGRPYAVVAALAELLLAKDRALLDAIGRPARGVIALLSPLAAPADAPPGPLSRHQVIGAMRRLLLAASNDGDTLLRVDDAHLADDADIDVLLHLASAGPPLCVVLEARPPARTSALARGLARLLGSGALKAIELAPLADDETRRLVAQVSERPLTEDTAARIARLADGNPFAAIELARCAAATITLAQLPASRAEAITARLVDLPDDARAMLQGLALAGDDFDATAAPALAAAPEANAFALLDAALAAGVLVVSDARYRFRHELVRQALIDQIAPHRRLKMHRQIAQRLAELDAPPALVARHWLAGGSPAEASPWLLAAAHDAMRLAAFSDALHQLEPLLAFRADHAVALRLRAEALDAIGDPAALAAYRAAADAADEPASHDLRAKGALAQIKQGDARGALKALEGVRPASVEGRLAEALTYSGAAALGATDPAMGTAKSAEARRLALESGDAAAIVVASWAQAAAAHARGELHRSVWADLHETAAVPYLATRVFDGQLCITQRFLYGARPYPQVIAFAESLVAEAQRLGAARGQAFGTTLRGEAELLSGDLDAAEQHLMLGARLHREIGGCTGEAFSLQRLAEAAMYRGRFDEAHDRLDQALDVARQTDIGFHLLDRIYGARIQLAQFSSTPASALHALEEAREAVRGPLETCPGCRITFAVPAAIAAARARRLDLAEDYHHQSEYLANVVMRLPAWYAAHDEVRGHMAVARGEDGEARQRFAAAAGRFREAGQPRDAQRCDVLADSPGAI